MNDLTAIEVDLSEPLPRVCLKCAATNELVRRPETLNVVSQTARQMGMVGGVVGAVTASTFRNARELFVPMLVVIGVAIAIFAWWSQRNAQRVEVALPLCVACDQRWSKAKAARPYFLAAFVVSAVGVLVGLGTESKEIIIAGGGIFFAVCIYAVITKPATAYVGASSVAGSRLTLVQVNERAVSMMRSGEVPRKKKKKKSGSTASEPTTSEPNE